MGSKLKECPSCGKEVAKSAKVCPHCGVNLKKKYVGKIFLLFIIVGIAYMALKPTVPRGEALLNDVSKSSPSSLLPTGDIATALKMSTAVLREEGASVQEEEASKEAYENKKNEVERQYKNQIVEWTLNVFKVERDNDNFEVTTVRYINGEAYASAAIFFYPANQKEKEILETLRKGSYITFKGKIERFGLSVDLIIDPAILIAIDGEKI